MFVSIVVWHCRSIVYVFSQVSPEYGVVSGVVFFQAEDGIRDLVRSRGLGDVYKRQPLTASVNEWAKVNWSSNVPPVIREFGPASTACRVLSLIHI